MNAATSREKRSSDKGQIEKCNCPSEKTTRRKSLRHARVSVCRSRGNRNSGRCARHPRTDGTESPDRTSRQGFRATAVRKARGIRNSVRPCAPTPDRRAGTNSRPGAWPARNRASARHPPPANGKASSNRATSVKYWIDAVWPLHEKSASTPWKSRCGSPVLLVHDPQRTVRQAVDPVGQAPEDHTQGFSGAFERKLLPDPLLESFDRKIVMRAS